MNRKADYIFLENNDDDMKLNRFEWSIDGKNNAVISWDWPRNRIVKLMFIFEWESEKNPDTETLLREGYKHEVVTRDLSAKYTTSIDGKRKFIAVPGYFNEDKGITVYKPAYVTDWLYKKISLVASATYKPLPLSQFQKATLRVTISDKTQLPLVCEVLKYAVYEQGRKIGEYPLDSLSMSGACGFYIKKEQQVKFIFDDNYSHLIDFAVSRR
ncbi:MAG: hypothetical protein FWF81_12040 [Defluviitaleaceae bacterium]|nr:hypothetical protein [Defluviitaleaceae bacterium]